MQLGSVSFFLFIVECSLYTPHMFINKKGEYECTILETNRIRKQLGLQPLEESLVY